jgi:SAM-dependent methyltransferase
LSTVIHHFPDLPRCASELRRVLTDGGVVLVRGLFAELGHPGGVELLPGWRRAVAAFPSTAAITATLSESGLRAIAAVEVRDVGPMTVGEAADRVRRLRHADSLLGQLTEDEIDAGLAAMDGSDPEHRLAPSTLGLLAFSAGAR